MKNLPKCFDYEVTVVFTQRVHAKSEKIARKELKQIFAKDYNVDIEDDEIQLLK